MPSKKSKSRTSRAAGNERGQSRLVRMGPPRLDKYDRLISRFYEALSLLCALGQVRGSHTSEHLNEGERGFCRQFLGDLAFLCEYEKGGDACTAIGVEDDPECLVYWVAANCDPQEKIVPFLNSVFEELRQLSLLSSDQVPERTDIFTARCIDYARSKVKKLGKLMQSGISKCKDHLRQDSSEENVKLADWLDSINQTSDLQALCHMAYESRKSDAMKRLERLSRDPVYLQATNNNGQSCFAVVRHYIGRLADHVRVPERVIRGLSHVEKLVLSELRVEAVPIVECVSPPQPDDLTTVDGICTRMFRQDDSRVDEIRTSLEEMDRQLNIMTRIRRQFEDENFQPRIHAEIQVLEYFHDRNLAWLDSDRFVACSKPACFCCQLYFRHHPACPVEPASHQKVYRNWGPPLLAGGSNDPKYEHQRDILNKVVVDIRKDAQTQIRQKRSPHTFRADSRTGITSTALDGDGDGDGDPVSEIRRGLGDISLNQLGVSPSSIIATGASSPRSNATASRLIDDHEEEHSSDQGGVALP